MQAVRSVGEENQREQGGCGRGGGSSVQGGRLLNTGHLQGRGERRSQRDQTLWGGNVVTLGTSLGQARTKRGPRKFCLETLRAVRGEAYGYIMAFSCELPKFLGKG